MLTSLFDTREICDLPLEGPVDRPLVYLACPYASGKASPDLRRARFRAANRATAMLMKHGFRVFSPISHSHPIAEAGNLPLHWDYWQDFDRVMLRQCYCVVVLKLDGWDRSSGVQEEVRIAREADLPVFLMDEV